MIETTQPQTSDMDWHTDAAAFLEMESHAAYCAWRDALPAPQRERHRASLTRTVKNPPRWPGPDEGLRLLMEALDLNDEATFKHLRYGRVVHGIREWV